MKKLISGFTLIELLICIAIIGILSSIALPSYLSYMQDGRRADIQHQILQQVAILERQYTRMGGYPDSLVIAATDYYSFTYAPSAAAALTPATNDSTTFTIQAQPTHSQSTDKCGTLSVNHQGIQGVTSGMIADCWN